MFLRSNMTAASSVFLPIGDAVLIVIPVKMDLNIHPTQVSIDPNQIMGLGRTVPVSVMGEGFAHLFLRIQKSVSVPVAESH